MNQVVQPLDSVADRVSFGAHSGRAAVAWHGLHWRVSAGLDFNRAFREPRRRHDHRRRGRPRFDLRVVRASRHALAGAGGVETRGSAAFVHFDALHPVRLLDVHQSRDVARPRRFHDAICSHHDVFVVAATVLLLPRNRARTECLAGRRCPDVSGGVLSRGPDDARSCHPSGHRCLRNIIWRATGEAFSRHKNSASAIMVMLIFVGIYLTRRAPCPGRPAHHRAFGRLSVFRGGQERDRGLCIITLVMVELIVAVRTFSASGAACAFCRLIVTQSVRRRIRHQPRFARHQRIASFRHQLHGARRGLGIRLRVDRPAPVPRIGISRVLGQQLSARRDSRWRRQ